MKRRLKQMLDWIVLLLTGRGPLADEAEELGICDYSGQGREKKKGGK